MQMLSVPQDEVARVVVLDTSGTAGDQKSLFLSQADMECDIGNFHHSMSTIVKPDQA